MSNPFKAVGKVFKGVVKVVKKIALPALAIGAVALTGGAALGVLPALGGAGGLLASVGIKGALAGILTTAAKGATIGAIGSALTGGDILKGATTGFMVGGATGGLGAALGGGTQAVQAGAETAQAGADAANAANTAAAASGDAFSQYAQAGLNTSAPAITQAGAQAAGPAAVSSAVPSVIAPPSSGDLLSSIFGTDPMTRGMALQGLGRGLAAHEEDKWRKSERDRIVSNYSGDAVAGLPGFGDVVAPAPALPDAGAYYSDRVYQPSRLEYDRRTNRIRKVGAG